MNEIFTRRSVRKFLNKSIKDEDIELIIKAGVMAPSAKNQQPWEFIVTKSDNVKQEIAGVSAYSKFIKEAALVITLIMRNDALTTPDMVQQDMSLCAQNMMLEARHLGIGSCYVGVYPKEERISYLEKTLNIKPSHTPFCILAFGYPKEENAFKYLERDYLSKVHEEKF